MQRTSIALLILILLAGCRDGREHGPPLFERLSPNATGITFANELTESPDFNILNYLNYYNGGGVAAGDVNGDGLPDLYFTSNLGPNRLYLNRGDFRFEDVTEQAGVAGTGNWTTGVTMADVNGDGLLDLYVSVVSGYLDRTGKNQLFINNGDGTFTDRAAEYGLDFAGYSTHAAFFDYDGDGDLDVFLVNHSTHYEGTHGRADLRHERHARAGDRLLRNDTGSGSGTGSTHFTDVSEEAGIYGGAVGYGLSIVVSDLNLDGCPDVYVGNDFHENDYLYYNNGDGTFTEAVRTAMGHTSQSSMGTDAADFNNDGRPDLVVLDMLPEREDILKTSAGADGYDLYNFKRKIGYHHQMARNTLQLNQGHGRFSDIGYLAGVEATDWSWASLFADLDNDGRKDLFVTNGIYRRPNDLDYVNHVASEAVQASLGQGINEENLTLIERMPRVPIPNYAFRNDGDLTFTNTTAAWGLDHPGFSNGAAYVDLDGDGALDLVVNNINEPASIYRNRAATLTDHHYLTVILEGDGANTAGIGTKVLLKHEGQTFFAEQMPTRGWQSSVDPRLHFGLGSIATVDSLVAVWPDGRFQTLRQVATNRTITLRQQDAAGTYAYAPPERPDPLFEDVTEALALDYRHEENTFIDFNREALMPHQLSMEGPALAVGDVNGDGLDDVYAGGAKWQLGRLLVQQPDGRFLPTNEALWQADSLHEDVDAVFFDANGNGHLDLYVVSGGNEFWGEADALRDRLYLNDGRGTFRRADDALPPFFANGSVVAPADVDGDGDLDLFVGSRVVTSNYGATPQSYLLENDGTGRFTDVTTTRADGLSEVGMVTDAAWLDYDGDGALDLVVVGEWMPLRIFAQREGRLVDQTAAAGLDGTNGWWNTVTAADLDGDGDLDLVAGNLGLNSKVKAAPAEPARLYAKDFDGNGSLDQILTSYRNGVSYPVASVDQLKKQIQPLGEQYASYAAYGARRVEDLFTPDQLQDASVLEAYTFATSYAENNGDGTFTLRPLPTEAQFAPVNSILAGDVDGDGHPDLILAGNFFGVDPSRGRYDASYGLLLRGDGRGGFPPVDPEVSNLYLEGDVRDVQPLTRPDGTRLLLVARNNDRLQAVRLQPATGQQALADVSMTGCSEA